MSSITCCVLRSNIKLFNQMYGIRQSSRPVLNQNVLICNARYLSKEKGTHRPNTLEKYLLVWMKKYPSVSEVPSTVSVETMERTRNWARIKINIIICIITGVVCIFMVYSGKQAAKRGESIRKMNIKWHEEQNAKKE